MTSMSRAETIGRGLQEYRAHTGATRDTLRIPLRGSTLLEVIEIPLGIPLLNAESFRIAPRLADHDSAELVRSDPLSDEAQRVVADLVRASHRHVDELKESLLNEGQDQPGVITPDGVLINGNTRCVLLRELVREGRSSASTLRVAVLPADVGPGEQLGLESVLQKQREYKDEYNLVSELMMIEKLYSSAKMTDQQIATSLRTTGGAKRVKELREVLVLMHRARNLSSTPMSLTAFVAEQDQRQNWLELLRDVREIEPTLGREGADAHIRRWLLAYYSGNSSVHRLRSARGSWVEKEVIVELTESGDGAAAAIAAAASTALRGSTVDSSKPVPKGLDLLGGPRAASQSEAGPQVQNMLDMMVDADLAGDGNVTLPNGQSLPAPDVRASIHAGVKASLEVLKRRESNANKLTRPITLLGQAKNTLRDVVDALDDVIDDPSFRQYRASVAALLEDTSEVVESSKALLNERDSDV
jgi:hypothetical protein